MAKTETEGGRIRRRPAPEELASLYQTNTSTELARRYGVSSSTIRVWVTRLRRGQYKEA